MCCLVFSFEVEHHILALQLSGVTSFALEPLQLAGSADYGPAPVFANGLAVVDDLFAHNAIAELVAAGGCFSDVSAHAGTIIVV